MLGDGTSQCSKSFSAERMSVVSLSELKSEETVGETSKDDAIVSPNYHNTAMQMSLFLSLQVGGEK